ncbi:hypothetical protein [Rhizobium bangladeshense]|uniref:hypothetical protein n=1 Tax=Rhizobium bangladeshense TaxID=1138189 RepID=UPI0007E57035|nr:hypothetical protein [Rhizobium bangladeshense]
METRALFNKAEATLRAVTKEAEFILLALRGAEKEAETEHLRANEARDWEDKNTVLAATHAYERYSAISLAVRDVSGFLVGAQSALDALDMKTCEWAVYAARNDIAA